MLSNLQQQQEEFSDAIVRHQDDHNSFTYKLKKSSKITPQLALDIYRNNSRGARIDTLALVYPVCKDILGDEVFRSIAREYVFSYQDRQPDLNYYGELLNRHFQSLLDAGRLPGEYIYLPDLAELEYKIHTAYYADNDREFNFQLFESKIKKEETFCLKTSASLGLLKSKYPIHDIWLNNKRRQPAKKIYAIENNQYLLVFRDHYKPDIYQLSEKEYLFLDACINEVSFQELIENSNYEVDAILPKLIADKRITGIK